MKESFDSIISRVLEKDPRYKKEAYEFVMEALSYTQRRFKAACHVTSQELLQGIREFLLQQFGPMTMAVLNHWGVRSSEDFGNIVFNLVEREVLSKTKDDDISHFRDAFDFEKVFYKDYRKQLQRRVSRLR
jgi:uncharacterized repeat protein (TIGR04138 family)